MGARILVIDDDPKITAMLQRALTYEGYRVEVANDGYTGLAMAKDNPPDLLILDIMLPGPDGWEICQRFRQENVIPILILSARDEVESKVKGLNLGADDYLGKPFALAELLARIQALLRRQGNQGRVIQFSGLKLDPETREVRRAGRPLCLTAREFDLLYLLLSHANQVLTRDQIIDKVWGLDYTGNSNLVEVYINMLRQKLEEYGPRLIHTVRGVGYVLREQAT
ncbi:response regulator transcription factor [Desulforamulus hydrothermalis]|uniref:Stage 0 sporulation protein A homolog n=1 Tax=Desulforamulus hydrothermalis Lam5 = DSM 18033 TaxID=1121428 RepID=K8EAX1_9FIRM|nr:response regulator [Desulforamulus hydrothermalis]CCO08798.1 DNA-binding response regulator in two-component system with YedV [Desulforamulus hydrothermalis Lam5 = DSM 18033]SHG71782.1 two-component system, OmpR family, response regulator [Desulforamulus hydrothermalis Lam5 = DSM 18033]